MIISHLELVDFRNYVTGSFDLDAGTTVVIGDNGQGKTNLAEALAFMATLSSFRSAPGDALVRVGATAAVIRATVVEEDARESLIEIELATTLYNAMGPTRLPGASAGGVIPRAYYAMELMDTRYGLMPFGLRGVALFVTGDTDA